MTIELFKIKTRDELTRVGILVGDEQGAASMTLDESEHDRGRAREQAAQMAPHWRDR